MRTVAIFAAVPILASLAATGQLQPNGYAGSASAGRFFFSPQGVATSITDPAVPQVEGR